MPKYKITKGTRFGRLTVVSQNEADGVCECICSCGKGPSFLVPEEDLVSMRVVACHNCGITPHYLRKTLIDEYGSLSSFDYESAGIPVCSCCGFPEVYAKGLCCACYGRLVSKGTLEYMSDAEIEARRQSRKNRLSRLKDRDKAEYEKRVSDISLPLSRPEAKDMRKMYIEDGLTYEQIGAVYGITRQRAYQILHTKRKRGR